MNMEREVTLATPQGVAVVERSDALGVFQDPHCAAAIWRRSPAQDVVSWLDALDSSLLPNGRMVLPRANVRAAVGALFEVSKTPICAARSELIDDIVALAGIFGDLMRAPYLRVRLEAVQTNACRKFHMDMITARLVCTYRGTGTQYGTSQEGADPIEIFTVPTGTPVLLRGSLWPEAPASGLLHRSPPIEGTGETRLVLVVDPVFDPEVKA